MRWPRKVWGLVKKKLVTTRGSQDWLKGPFPDISSLLEGTYFSYLFLMFPVDFPDLPLPKAIKHHSDRMFLHLQLRGSCLGDHRWYPPLGPQNRWYTGIFLRFFFGMFDLEKVLQMLFEMSKSQEKFRRTPHLIIFDPFVCWREVQWLTGSHNTVSPTMVNGIVIVLWVIWFGSNMADGGWRVARFWTPHLRIPTDDVFGMGCERNRDGL